MKKTFINPVSAIRYTLAVVAGFALTLAFPKWNVAGAAWVGPGLMLFSALGVSGAQAFRLGFVAGLTHALSSLYWLLLIPYTFHGIPLGPGAGWLALGAYVAVYHGVWVWICWRIFPASPGPQPRPPKLLQSFLSRNWRQRVGWAFACAVVWVAMELIRSHFISGFPWNLLGSSQFQLLPLIQVASIAGVYSVSFLVVWTSVSIGMALIKVAGGQPDREQGWIAMPGQRAGSLMGDVFLPLLAVALVIAFGANRVFSKSEPRGELKVACVQPSIPQTVIWDSDGDAARFQKVLELSEQALASKPDLLVWPESAFPEFNAENFAAVTKLVVSHHVWLILCADDADPPSTPNGSTKYYNASFLISPNGEVISRYRKKRLVIFGEYVPLADWLPFLKWFTPIEGGFTPGPGPVPFELTRPSSTTSVLICFEDVFPHEVRDHVENSTDFLINLTNDGWFGEGACQWQQAAAGVLRAVENGVPLLRCTNNGITCWIDGHGRICQIGNPENVYGAGFMISNIPLYPPGTRAQTFYNQNGDWFAWGCSGLTLLLTGVSFLKERKRTQGA